MLDGFRFECIGEVEIDDEIYIGELNCYLYNIVSDLFLIFRYFLKYFRVSVSVKIELNMGV